MRYTVLLPALAVLAAVTAGPSMAQSVYSADDIIKRFAPALSGSDVRALCVGTETECNEQAQAAAAAPPPQPFDLLVTFEFNSNALTSQAKQNLNEFAKALKDPRLSGGKFAVEGHTDARGGDRYNLVLSQKRAGAVVKYLASAGVRPDRLLAKGYGKEKPRDGTDPLDPVNRRVEARLAQ
jgi:outer membrane protein OmpA-like peptidoglycan-associated protein